ncbi:MAG: biopolymer transporter ExbD [Candidatus Cloacimonetes bacterium]|nr:biopolymer transporter ExbD [Candidatus Cloacimonadota bacterium]
MALRSSKPGTRVVRKKADDVQGLSITSLLDVLTIILVFLIKNVSMEAVKISELPDMIYPTTITTENLMENAAVTPVKIYTDRVLLGNDNQLLGSPADLTENPQVRSDMVNYLRYEFNVIPEDKKDDACLIVQSDSNIPCGYITEIVGAAVGTGFANIYFATLEDEQWLQHHVSSTGK